jgi:hypothetical protein
LWPGDGDTAGPGDGDTAGPGEAGSAEGRGEAGEAVTDEAVTDEAESDLAEAEETVCVVIWDAVEWNPPVTRTRALTAAGLDPDTAEVRAFSTEWGWRFFNWTWPPGFEERRYEWGYVRLSDEACR